MVTAKVDIVQWICVVLEFIVATATGYIMKWYCVVLEIIVVTANLIYCNGTVLCVWSLFLLKQQYI